MKAIIPGIVFTLFSSTITQAQSGEARIWGGLEYDNTAQHVLIDRDSNLVVSGFTPNFHSTIGSGLHLSKWSKSGQMLWTKYYELPGAFQLCNGMVQTKDNGYVLVGKFTDVAQSNGSILKVDKDGNLMWDQALFGLGADSLNTLTDVAEGSDGSLYVTGWAEVATEFVGFVMKLSATGTVVYDKYYKGPFDVFFDRILLDAADKPTVFARYDAGINTGTLMTEVDNTGNLSNTTLLDPMQDSVDLYVQNVYDETTEIIWTGIIEYSGTVKDSTGQPMVPLNDGYIMRMNKSTGNVVCRLFGSNVDTKVSAVAMTSDRIYVGHTRNQVFLSAFDKADVPAKQWERQLAGDTAELNAMFARGNDVVVVGTENASGIKSLRGVTIGMSLMTHYRTDGQHTCTKPVSLPISVSTIVVNKSSQSLSLVPGNAYAFAPIGMAESTPMFFDSSYCNVSTGILNAEKNSSTMEIYPNPAADKLFVTLPHGWKSARFEIYNGSGQLLISGETKETTPSIFVGELQEGMHILLLRNKEEQLSNRFLIQR